MPNIRAQAVLFHDSGLPEDVSVNTFHFTSALAELVAGAFIGDALTDFYGTDVTGGNAIRDYLSSTLSGSGEVRMYNMDDPEPRVPFLITTLEFVPSTATALPAEVALVSSFHGELVSGTPQARRRGRVYIGPLGATALNASFIGRPDPTFREVVAGATKRLADDLEANGVTFVVFSEVADTFTEVVAGWVDDAWDTQRRRGVQATDREVWAKA